MRGARMNHWRSGSGLLGLVFAISAVSFPPVAAQDHSPDGSVHTEVAPHHAEALRLRAEAKREQAGVERRQADEYRALADQAREAAGRAETADAQDVEVRRAADRDRRADELEASAARLDAEAVALEEQSRVWAAEHPREDPPPPPAEAGAGPRLAGQWIVSYWDAALGGVTGRAWVEDDERHARVVLEHPRTGAERVLRSSRITRRGDEVKILLEGASPAAGDADFQVMPRQILTEQQTGALPLRLGNGEGEIALRAAEEPDADLVTLTLTLTEHGLNGRWETRVDPTTGRDGTGGGRLGHFLLPNDGSGLGLQRGDEFWNRPEAVIEAAFATERQFAVDVVDGRRLPDWPYPFEAEGTTPVTPLADRRRLFVIGHDLPTSRLSSVELVSRGGNISYYLAGVEEDFADPAYNRYPLEAGWNHLEATTDPEVLERLRELPVVLIDAVLKPGVRPGLQSFTLDGTEVEWLLQFGDHSATVDIVRPLPTGHWQATEHVFRPERVAIEIRADNPLPFTELPVLIGRNGQVLTFEGVREVPAYRVPGEPLLYRTPDIMLYDSSRPQDAGQATLKIPVRPGNTILRPGETSLKPDGVLGDTIFATLGDQEVVDLRPKIAKAHVLHVPADAGAMISGEPERRMLSWKDGLNVAARCAGMPVHDWRQVSYARAEVFKPVIPVREGVKLSLAHHASLLVLRSLFADLLGASIGELERLRTDTEHLALHRDLESAMFHGSAPIGAMEITAPDGARIPFLSAFLPGLLEREYGLAGAALRAWQVAATREAVTGFVEAMRASQAMAEGVDECDVEELLKLAFMLQPVAEKAKPLMMRLVDLPPFRGSAHRRLAWVPETFAPFWLDDTIEKADEFWVHERLNQRDIALIQIGVAVATAGLGYYGAAAMLYATVVLDAVDYGYSLFVEPMAIYESQREVVFARGAAAVIGLRRFELGKESALSDAEYVMPVLFGTVGLASTGRLVLNGVRAVRTGRAIRRGQAVLEGKTVADIPDLSRAERRDAFAAVVDAMRKRRVAGEAAMTPQERALLAFADEGGVLARTERGTRPRWARGLDQDAYEQLRQHGMHARRDIIRLSRQQPTKVNALVRDPVAFEVMRGDAIADLAQLEGAIAAQRKRLATPPPSRALFDQIEPRAPPPAENGLLIVDGETVGKVVLRNGPAYEGELARLPGRDPNAPVPDSIDSYVYLGSDHEIAHFIRGRESTQDGETLVLSLAEIDAAEMARRGRRPWLTGFEHELTEKGIPLALYMNLRSYRTLGFAHGDPNLAVIEVSGVMSVNTAVHLHWLRKQYPDTDIGELARLTPAYRYAETMAEAAGHRVVRVEVDYANALPSRAGNIKPDYYDHRVPFDEFMARYDIGRREQVEIGFSIRLHTRPRDNAAETAAVTRPPPRDRPRDTDTDAPPPEVEELTPESLARMGDDAPGPVPAPERMGSQGYSDFIDEALAADQAGLSPPISTRPDYVPERDALIGDLVDAYHHGNGLTPPPIHITDQAGLNGIISNRFWEQPSGASFSYPGQGTAYGRGPVALRINPEAEQKIEWIEDLQGRGLIPVYWEDGVRNGKPKNYIPAELLQRFDYTRPGLGEWVSLTD